MRVSLLAFSLLVFTSVSLAQPVAHWPLDETSGNTATDIVGGKNGSLQNFDGSQWRPGKIGGALFFDGWDDYVSHDFKLNRFRGTLMHWVLPEGFGRGILYYESDFGNPDHPPTDYNGFSAGGTAREIHTAWKGDDGEFCFYYQDGPEEANECDADHLIADGWNHVAVTWDIEGDLILYINCQEAGRDEMDKQFIGFTTSEGYFGRPSDEDRFFHGLIDDIRVYNEVLTPEEITEFCQDEDFQSSILATEREVRDDEFAVFLCDQILANGRNDIKDVTLLLQTPFGGGFLESMQEVFDNGGACDGIPWIAGSASGALELPRGWSDLQVDMNSVDFLGSAWTQAIAGPAGNIGGAPGVIVNGSATNNVREDLLAAHDIDVAGPNGSAREEPLIATGNGGRNIAWVNEGAGHEAVLLRAWGFNPRHLNNIDNMRFALQRTWQGQDYNIEALDNFSVDQFADAISTAIGRLDADSGLVIYVTGFGGSNLNFDDMACNVVNGPIETDRTCDFDLPPSWFMGLLGNHMAAPADEPALVFELDVESCDGCTGWEYEFNDESADLDLLETPGTGYVWVPFRQVRPGGNEFRIRTEPSSIARDGAAPDNQQGSLALSGMHLTTGALNDLVLGHSLRPGQSAAFYDPARDGEGIFVELLNNGLAVVYVFTYSADGTGQQAWMLGLGELIGEGIVITEMYRPTGPEFGPGFNPADRVLNPFGGLAFRFPTCGIGQEGGELSVSPPVDGGYEYLLSENYAQLTEIVDCLSAEGYENAGWSGSWYDKSHDGEGIIVQVLPDGRALVQWFTYDFLGNQMWVQGVGKFSGNTLTVDRMYTTYGATWGSKFDKDDVFTQDWGTLTMEFHDCGTATVNYQSAGFGNGELNMVRLTSLLGIPCD